MRDLFQKLIEYLAPTKVVKLQPWYEPVNDAPGKVSRRQRLKYMMYRSGEGFESNLQQMDKTANDAKEALDLAINRAHDHDPNLTPEEVKHSIDFARLMLNEVINFHEKHQN
jgi:hypothetical protein